MPTAEARPGNPKERSRDRASEDASPTTPPVTARGVCLQTLCPGGLGKPDPSASDPRIGHEIFNVA